MSGRADDRLGRLLAEEMQTEADSWQPDVARAAAELHDRTGGRLFGDEAAVAVRAGRRRRRAVLAGVLAAGAVAAAVAVVATRASGPTVPPPPAPAGTVRPAPPAPAETDVAAVLQLGAGTAWTRPAGSPAPRCTDPVRVVASVRLPAGTTSARWNWWFGATDDGQPRTVQPLPTPPPTSQYEFELQHEFLLPETARNAGPYTVGLTLETRQERALEAEQAFTLRSPSTCRP